MKAPRRVRPGRRAAGVVGTVGAPVARAGVRVVRAGSTAAYDTARRHVWPRVAPPLDRLVTEVVAVVVARVDVDAVVARVDVDAVAARLDVDAVLDRVDLTEVVLTRLELARLVHAVLSRLDPDDIDELVADALTGVEAGALDAVVRRVDVAAVLDRLDLTGVVLDRVDLARVVEAALAAVDPEALVPVAEQVVDGIDLSGIIRESTGAMASDTVRSVRLQGIEADERVGRAMDRLLLRRRAPSGSASGAESGAEASAAPGAESGAESGSAPGPESGAESGTASGSAPGPG